MTDEDLAREMADRELAAAPPPRRRWIVVDWRLFAAIAVLFASASVFIATFQLGGTGPAERRARAAETQTRQLTIELDCRSRIASAGTVANLTLTSATGRGLALLAAVSVNDPELSAIVEEELGGSGIDRLREQVQAALDASNAAEEARAQRRNSEDSCRRLALETVEDEGDDG